MPGISENLMEIEHLSTDAITEYARNARKNADTVAAVKASIKEFGFQQPIVVDRENVVIVGHARLKAARELGLKTVPVTRADNLTPEQVRAYRLLDNKIAEHSKWDNELLQLELSELHFNFEPFDVSFDVKTALPLTADDISATDDVPGLSDEPYAQSGDVWYLGENHILFCGDAADLNCWREIMGGTRAHCVWTDPPYGVNYVGKTKDALTIQNDGQAAPDLCEAVLRNIFEFTANEFSGYLAHPAGAYSVSFSNAITAAGFVIKQNLVWVKNQFALGRSNYHYRHEPIIYFGHPKKSLNWHGGRSKDSVFEVEKPKANDIHPTMKPLRLIALMLENSATRGQIVVDPFGGSGSTLMVCEDLGLASRLIELDPKYCDQILRRWIKHTNRIAVRHDGRKYGE